MDATLKTKGPWTHRAAIWLFAAANCLLVYWLLGFIVNDIGNVQGTSYEDVELRMLDPSLSAEREQLPNGSPKTSGRSRTRKTGSGCSETAPKTRSRP